MNKSPTIVELLQHCGTQQIKVTVSNQENATAFMRQVPDRKLGKTYVNWYVPFSADAYTNMVSYTRSTVNTLINASTP